MKREVSAPRGADVKAPEAPKTEIREFGEAIRYMVDQMQKRWRNQVLEGMNKGTVEKFETTDKSPFVGGVKFEDSQTGNFAKIYLALANKATRKMKKQFSDERLEKLAKKYTGKVNNRNKREFYNRIQNKIGISAEELEATEGLTFQINAFQLETYQWLRKMRDDTMSQWTSNTLRDMAEGKALPEIMSQFEGMVEKRRNHAEMVARTQISTFNSLVSKTRARNLGIEKAVWLTAKDERVRACHRARNEKEFDLAEGLFSSCDGKTLLPGVDFNCRCDYRMIIPEMDY